MANKAASTIQKAPLYLAAARDGQTSIDAEAAPRGVDRWLEQNPAEVWIDLLAPTAESLAYIKDRFNLHPLAIEECDHSGVHPKIEQFENHLYIVLHGINNNPGEDQLNTVEFKFFLRRNLLISVHDKPSSSVRGTQERLERDRQLLSRGGVDTVFHRIVDTIIDHYFPILEDLEAQLLRLESEIFRDPSDQHLEEMMALQRKLLTLHRIIHPQQDILGALSSGRFPEIEAADVAYFRDVYDHLQRIGDRIQIAREMLTGAMQCYLSQVANRTNTVMKSLAILATIVLPVTFLTSLLGMNLQYFPGRESPATFWLVIAVSAVVSVASFVSFRRARWL
ncbi:MAG: magnesium/cobalt transporter CorA [Armatimonadota bacterium]|nr:magnesium/cobalt transporter CorA [Armatimonadota bacterium]